MGLQRHDICLQSKLLTRYLIFTILLFTALLCFSVFRAHSEQIRGRKRMFVKPGDSDFVKHSLTFLEICFLGQKIDK